MDKHGSQCVCVCVATSSHLTLSLSLSLSPPEKLGRIFVSGSQHWSMMFFMRSGQVEGIGRVLPLSATEYATVIIWMPSYGVWPVTSSHSSTP
jgi:hypothetical protein